jgi:vitamin B12 transporter
MSTLAQQRTSLSGKITTSGNAEVNAIVQLISTKDETIKFVTRTDNSGTYLFENVPVGKYKIIAGPGEPMRRSVSLGASAEINLQPGKTRNVDLQFTFPGAPIEATVTVSADQSQPIDEVSKTVNIISGQEMRDRADFALAESLRTIPGFRVQQLGGFGRTATVKTRGLRIQDTAILIDGVRLRDASGITGDASPFLSDLTLTSVSKVEILRGSGSSLYGTNAIGGTVDFQTPKPQAGLHGQVSYAAGGLGLQRFRGNISDGTDNGKFGFNLAAARTVYTEGIDGEDDSHNTNFQSRVEYNPYSRTNISGRFFISDAYVRLNNNPDTFGTLPVSNSFVIDAVPGVNFLPDQNDPISNQKSKFFNGQLAFNQALTSKSFLSGYYSGLRTSRKNDNSGFSTSFFDGLIQTANATINWAPDSVHDVKIGYEFEHEKFGNEGVTPSGTGNFFTRAFQSSNTFFAQDVVSLFDRKLQFAAGFRAQFFSLGDPRFSLGNAPYSGLAPETPPAAYTFDGAVSYFFKDTGTKVRAHVGNGYRVPSLYERYGTFFSTFGGAAFIALGDPDLRPEKTIAFDGGIDQYLAGEKVKLSVAYFYTKLIDTIGYGNVVPDIGTTVRPFGGYENQKGGIARGVELSATIKPTTSTDIFASYTLTNSDQLVPQVSGSGVIESLGIPRHQFTLVATQRIKRFWVNFDLLATSKYLAPIYSNAKFNTYVFRFGGNSRADLTAGYTFPLNKDKFSLRIFGTVENLFDYEYFENGFRTVPRNGRIGLSFGF